VIDIIAEPMFEHQIERGQSFAEGLRRHGVASRIVSPQGPATSDTVVCWGWRIAAPLVAAGKRVLVMERGYIGDRMKWTSMGWNGLNGRAQFGRGPVGRFDQHQRLMQPWNPKGSYALLIGQVDGDAALYGMQFQPWAVRIASQASKAFELPVKFRPHPVAIEYGQNYPVHGTDRIYGTLADALGGAAVVITFNSNAGVDAVLAGKPTITFDPGSMAWPVTSHDWTIPPEPDRKPWAEWVSGCQWSADEIRNGTAWEYVNRGSPS